MKLNYFNFKKVNDKFLLTNDFGMYVYLNETKENRYAKRCRENAD